MVLACQIHHNATDSWDPMTTCANM